MATTLNSDSSSSDDDYNFWTSSETEEDEETEESADGEVEAETEEDIEVDDESDEDVDVETEEEAEEETDNDILEDETDENEEAEADTEGEEKTNTVAVAWNCSPAKQASLLTTIPAKIIKSARSSRATTATTISENREKVKTPIRDTEVDHNGNSIPKPDDLNTISTTLEAKRKRKKRHRPVTICLTHCRYEIVKSVASSFGLKSVGETENWNIYWTDFSVSLDRAMDLKRFQIVNHFPGMNEICRKDLLARNLNRMKKLFHKDYDIFPRTWSLPADLGDLQMYHATHRNKTYICKPEMGCQGRGIFLVRNIRDLNPFGKIICQMYLQKPFLIDDLKFDLRIYVLMTSCDPLRIYFYNEGLARFATAKYKLPTNHNTENSYMHLTNYAVNKYSRDFVPDDAVNGSKRKYTAVLEWFKERKYDTHAIEAQIEDVIIKTIITAQPILKHNYKTCFPNHDICCACFEILGFDIILDMNLKPYVLEVNHSPSFHTDSQIDKEIKENLLRDTFAIFNLKLLDRRKIQGEDRKRVIQRLVPSDKKDAEVENPNSKTASGRKEKKSKINWEQESVGGYRLIYPSETSSMYDKFFDQNLGSIYQGTAASQARVNQIRNQIEEYNLKKQEEDKKRSVSSGGSVINRVKDLATQSKELLTPEKELKPLTSKWPLHTNRNGDSFKVHHIIAEEELDRLKGLMQRGIMIRSMGVEVHVYKLLSDMGCIKPKDEKLFRRLHGFTNHFKTKSQTEIRISVRPPTPNKPAMGPVPTPEQTSGMQSQVTSQSQSPRTTVTTSSANSSVEEPLSYPMREDGKKSVLDSYNISLHYTSSDINGNHGASTYRYNPYGPRAGNIFPDSKYGGPAIKNLSLGGSDPSYNSFSSSQMKVSQHRPQLNLQQYTSTQSHSPVPKRVNSEMHRSSFGQRRAQFTTECYNSGYAINVATNRVMPSVVASDANSGDRFNTFGSGDQLEAKRLGLNFARQCGLQQRLPSNTPTQWSAERGYFCPNNNTPAAFQNNNSISSLRTQYLASEAKQNLNNAYGDDEFSHYTKRSPRDNIQSGRLSGRNNGEKRASVPGIEDAGIVLPRKNKSKRSSAIQSQRAPRTPISSDLQGPMRVTQMFFDSKGLAQPRKPISRGDPVYSKSARASYNLLSAEIIPGRNLKAEIQTAKSSIPLIMPHTGRRIIAPRSEKIIYTNSTEDNLRLLQKGHSIIPSPKVGN